MIYTAIASILPIGLTLAAIFDLSTMKIPNRISFLLILLFLMLAPFSGISLQMMTLGFLAAVIVFLCGFMLFALNIMGGGDVKLLTASALWFGLNESLASFLISVAFVGGILTLAILFIRSRSQEIMASGLPVPDSLLVAKKVPYGIAIAIAGLLTYPDAPIVQAAMQSMF